MKTKDMFNKKTLDSIREILEHFSSSRLTNIAYFEWYLNKEIDTLALLSYLFAETIGVCLALWFSVSVASSESTRSRMYKNAFSGRIRLGNINKSLPSLT